MYLGDYAASDTLDFNFCTVDATGAPTALSSGAVSVYKGSSDVQSTAGVTLTASFDSVTGLNHVTIATASDGTFYADGNQFECVLTAGTVGGVSVVGYVVGRFTLRAQAPLYPTAAGRTLDVTATGAAGVDWANVENPGTAVNLSQTTLDPATQCTVVGYVSDESPGDYLTNWGYTPALATNLGTTNATVAANLNATVSSRQATFTDDTGVDFPTNFAAMDINATGGVGVDWGNVQNPTTTNNLSGTTVKAVTDPVTGGSTDLTSILGAALTEGAAGRLAGAFTTLLNVATPVLTVASVNQTGDSFGRIGATGSGLTSLAPSATALSTAVWTNTLATNLGTTNTTVATNLNAAVSSRQATFTAATGVTFPANFDSALTLPTDAQLVKVLAAVYDSNTSNGSNALTLSDGAVQTYNLTTGARTTT